MGAYDIIRSFAESRSGDWEIFEMNYMTAREALAAFDKLEARDARWQVVVKKFIEVWWEQGDSEKIRQAGENGVLEDIERELGIEVTP